MAETTNITIRNKIKAIILPNKPVLPNKSMPNHRKTSMVKSKFPNNIKPFYRKISVQITEHKIN